MFGAWFDLNAGPVVFHSAPFNFNKQSGKRELASLEICTKHADGQRFTYKFCGVVDDLLFSTHVVRDIRQRDNALTSRQAMIAHAVRKAWELADTDHEAKAAKDEIRKLQSTMLGDRAAVPFAPPFYIHVSLVREAAPMVEQGQIGRSERRAGSILKKRLRSADADSNADFFVENARYRDLRLPETIISYILSTIVPCPPGRSREHRRTLGILAGRCGAQVLIDIIASKASVDWLRRSIRDVIVSVPELDTQERFVLRGLTYYHFLRHVRSCRDQQRTGVEPSASVLKELYANLHECGSWREVFGIATHNRSVDPNDRTIFEGFVQALVCPGRASFLRQFQSGLPKGRDIRDACRSIRRSLTGFETGTPLYVLGQVLKPELMQVSEVSRTR